MTTTTTTRKRWVVLEIGTSQPRVVCTTFQRALRTLGEQAADADQLSRHPGGRWRVIEIPAGEDVDYDGVIVAQLEVGRLG